MVQLLIILFSLVRPQAPTVEVQPAPVQVIPGYVVEAPIQEPIQAPIVIVKTVKAKRKVIVAEIPEGHCGRWYHPSPGSN